MLEEGLELVLEPELNPNDDREELGFEVAPPVMAVAATLGIALVRVDPMAVR